MNPGFFAAIWVVGLLGSVHCLGMCGPFVAFYAGERDGPGRGALGVHAAYHLGRLVTYASLGACAGAFGGGVEAILGRVGVARGAALVSAFLLVVGALVVGTRASAWLTGASKRLFGFGRPVLVQLRRAPRPARSLGLGLFTPLLPCGFLYSFVLLAAGTGSAVTGALALATFWVGTVPALLGFGFVFRAFGRRFFGSARSLPVVVLLGLGLSTIVFRVGLSPFVKSNDPLPRALSAEELPRPSCH